MSHTFRISASKARNTSWKDRSHVHGCAKGGIMSFACALGGTVTELWGMVWSFCNKKTCVGLDSSRRHYVQQRSNNISNKIRCVQSCIVLSVLMNTYCSRNPVIALHLQGAATTCTLLEVEGRSRPSGVFGDSASRVLLIRPCSQSSNLLLR